MKLYGSLNNRLDENKYFNGTENNLKVGTLATEYYWSDRKPYEVVKVINQKHIFIRELDAKRIDNNGMSDSQHYEYSSNENNKEIELKFTYGHWRIIRKDKSSIRINISFGCAEKYYDYSF